MKGIHCWSGDVIDGPYNSIRPREERERGGEGGYVCARENVECVGVYGCV